MSKFGYTALALIFAAMVSTCVAPQGKIGRALASFFSLSVLRSFGKYSYFIYVFHLMILYALGHLLDRATHSFNIVLGTYLSSFMGLIICYVLAAISWRLMEAPVLSFKRFFPYRVQPVLQKQPLESPAIR